MASRLSFRTKRREPMDAIEKARATIEDRIQELRDEEKRLADALAALGGKAISTNYLIVFRSRQIGPVSGLQRGSEKKQLLASIREASQLQARRPCQGDRSEEEPDLRPGQQAQQGWQDQQGQERTTQSGWSVIGAPYSTGTFSVTRAVRLLVAGKLAGAPAGGRMGALSSLRRRRLVLRSDLKRGLQRLRPRVCRIYPRRKSSSGSTRPELPTPSSYLWLCGATPAVPPCA